MNRTLIAFLLLIFPIFIIAQERTYIGIIKDLTTQMPIDLVSVSLANSNIGTVSNEEGNFRITIPDTQKKLQFSHLNYNLYAFTIADQDTLAIFLEPKTFTLDEVIVSNEPVGDMMKEILKNSRKHLENSILMNTYYREFGIVNGQYISFADGMLDYNIRKTSGKSDVYVKQSRAKKIKDAAMAKMQGDLAGFSFFDVEDAISDAYNFKKISNVLTSDSYDFVLRNKTDSKGNVVQIVSILPKADVEEYLYEGSVTYDYNSKLILEIDLHKAPSHEKYNKLVNILVAKAKVTCDSRKSIFRMDNGKYMLAYNSHRVGMHIQMRNRFDDDFESLSDVVNLDYKEGEFKMDRNQRFREKTLYKAGTKYTDEFWKTKNIKLLSAEEENIIKSLENETASVVR